MVVCGMKATDAIARISERFETDAGSDCQVITREEFEAISSFENKWATYSQMKRDWINQHPDATPEQVTQAEQRIATELGV